MSQEFWPRFVTEHWERAPLAVSDAGGDALAVSPNELFDTVVESCAAGEGKVWLRAREVPADFAAPYLPVADDVDFHGYDQRIRRTTNDGDYMLSVGGPQTRNVALWQRARAWLRPLIRRVGLPNRMVDMGVFLGRYRRTPFGVHIDYQSAITFPVIGRKVFVTWPDEYVRAHPELRGAMDFDAFHKGARELVADPGGLIYWPHTEWHVGVGTGELAVTLNISFWYAGDEAAALDLADSIVRARRARLETTTADTLLHLPLPKQRGPVGQLPEALTRAGEVLSTRILGVDQVRRRLDELWLRRVSADGFLKVPALREDRPLLPDMRVRGSTEWLVYWHFADGVLHIGIHGHVVALSVAEPASTIEVLERINSGALLSVVELQERIGTAAGDADAALPFLGRLYRARAFEIVDA